MASKVAIQDLIRLMQKAHDFFFSKAVGCHFIVSTDCTSAFGLCIASLTLLWIMHNAKCEYKIFNRAFNLGKNMQT